MKTFNWKYTQFSQFNESDTLLLVSGVLFGLQSTSGEIVVFNLTGNEKQLSCYLPLTHWFDYIHLRRYLYHYTIWFRWIDTLL